MLNDSHPKVPWRWIITAFALGGWAWALQQYWSGNGGGGETREVETRWKRSDRIARDGGFSLARAMDRPRSARLMSRLDEIAAGAETGVPNMALIRACEEALLDGDFESRHRDIGLLLELLRPEDAAALHETFLALHREGRGFVLEYSLFANQWGKIDPQGALDFLAAETPVRMPMHDVMNVVRGWAQSDPGAAREWLEEHPEIVRSKQGYVALLQGWVRTDPEAAKRFFNEAEFPPQQRWEAARSLAIELLYNGGLEESTDWIASLADPAEATMAWNAASIQFSELPYQTAADVWSKVGDKPWMSFAQFARFNEGISHGRVNGQGGEGFIDAVARVWPAEQAAEQFARWEAGNPEQVREWLQHAPDSPWVETIRSSLDARGGEE